MRGWICNLLVQLLLGLARAVTLGSKSRRTHGHILLSHLRLAQPGGPGPRIYILQEQGGPVLPPGTWFPFCRPLRLAGIRWKYSNLPPHGFAAISKSKSTSRYDWWSVSIFWFLAHSSSHDQMFVTVWWLLLCLCGASSLTRGQV
jgi:hypothetical protein